MGAPDAHHIAVCAAEESDLAQLGAAVCAGVGWSAIPIRAGDDAALAAAADSAHAYVLLGDGGSDPRLVAALGARPARRPLIVIGPDPVRAASPSLWLPALPPPGVLPRLLADLLDGDLDAGLGAPWRRKTDIIIGDSPAIRQLLRALDRLAPSQTPVLITGESGVGKELVARSLHYCGPRANAPFVAINCAAIPETLIEAELFGYQRGAFTGAVSSHTGAIEAAHNGTLFLDEIGEMPLHMQAKLLRVLETSEVQRIGSTERKKLNFRLVTATNRDLEQAVKDGRFREDLYYRVHVYPVHVPPLRDRPDDIPRLVNHYLTVIGMREHRAGLRVTQAALEQLIGYSWPGNVRELVNLLERAVLLAGDRVIEPEHVVLPHAAASSRRSTLVPYREAKARFESEYYAQLMRTAGGNVSLAAKLGHKTRKEIYDALRRCRLDARQRDKS